MHITFANTLTAQNLTFPDSLVPLYIAFLAWDEYVATHEKDALGGAPKVPGETDVEPDTEKVTGIALKIVDDLLKEAGKTLDEEDDPVVKEQLGEYVQEL